MNSTQSTNVDTSVRTAEMAVQESLNRFEKAMDHLAIKVDSTNQTIQKAKELAGRPVEKIKELKSSVMRAMAPVRPYISQASETSRGVVVRVRQNPRPLLAIALGIIGAYLVYRSMKNRKNVYIPVGFQDAPSQGASY